MLRSYAVILIAWGGLLWTTPLQAFFDGWDVQYEIEQFQLPNGETYNLISIAPVDIRAKLEAVPAERRYDLFWQLHWNRVRANVLLNYITEFVLSTIRSGMVRLESEPRLREHFQKIRSGRYPFMAVTHPRRESEVYQVFGMGIDSGDGLPNEVRLKEAPGMSPLPRTLGAEGPIPICYIPKTGKLTCDRGISDLLSKIPRKHGDAAEIRTLHKSKQSPHDFTEVLISRALSKHWLTWGARLLPVEERLPPLVEPLLGLANALKASHPEIPDELLYPEKQSRYAISHLYGHTLTDSREEVFGNRFGSERVMKPFPDIHFPGRLAHWISVDVGKLTGPDSPLRAALALHHDLNRVGTHWNDPLYCAQLLSTHNLEGIAALPLNFHRIWRLGHPEDYELPPDGYLMQIKSQYLRD